MSKYLIRDCIGCGVCANIKPKIFRMSNPSLAEIIDPVANEDEVKEAREQCPVGAIIIN